ncbi:MAG TPA: hypothetical protein VKQ52_18050 [Puia sp.]|nr:hypothetical protein [Puia sp.]
MKRITFILTILLVKNAAANNTPVHNAFTTNSHNTRASRGVGARPLGDPGIPGLSATAGVGMPSNFVRAASPRSSSFLTFAGSVTPRMVNFNHPKSPARESAAQKGTFRIGQPSRQQTIPDASIIDTTWPSADLSSGPLHARFYLPNAATGYYRSTRFDWSGVMPSLEYKGHTFFGQWFPKYDPTLNDAIMGPVESFTPIGYDQAQPGGPFLQLGVGILTRPDTSRYTPFKYYPIQNPGYWNITKIAGAIAFRQDLNAAGYSYVYIKTITFTPGQPQMVITHTLKNTGSQPLESDVYDHNFFVIDTQTVAPGRVLKLPWTPTASDARGLGELADIRGDSIVFLQTFAPRQSVYAILHGYGDKPADYDIRIEEHRTGAGVRIRCDRPLAKLAFWASIKTACPEPFIHIKAAPGETITWTLTYDFYVLTP